MKSVPGAVMVATIVATAINYMKLQIIRAGVAVAGSRTKLDRNEREFLNRSCDALGLKRSDLGL